MPRRSVEDLDDWAREHELRHAREREERKLEDGRLIEAVKKHVDGAMKPLTDMPSKLDAIARVNDEQLKLLGDAAEERGMRKQREADAARKKSDDELALAQARLEAETKGREDEREIETLKANNQRWQIVAGVITAVVVALIGALVAAHK